MFKKIILATLYMTIIGVLILGAVNRTLALSSNKSWGIGGSRFSSEENVAPSDHPGETYGQGNRRNGLGGGGRIHSTQP